MIVHAICLFSNILHIVCNLLATFINQFYDYFFYSKFGQVKKSIIFINIIIIMRYIVKQENSPQ